MKLLPYNLKKLILYLDNNNLGQCIQNMKNLADGIKYLPKDL